MVTVTTSSLKNRVDLSGFDGPAELPFVGSAYWLLRDYDTTARRWRQRYGDFCRISFLGKKGLAVLHPGLAWEVLVDRDRAFSSGLGYGGLIGQIFGRGLLLYDFEEHRFQRRILQDAFRADALRGYTDGLNSLVSQEIDNLPTDRAFKFYGQAKEILLKTSIQSFYGTPHSERQIDVLVDAFIDAVKGMIAIPRWNIPGTPFHKAMKARQSIRKYIEDQLERARDDAAGGILAHMCNARKSDDSLFSSEEIIDHAGFLLLAAHDTTASTVCNALSHLAQDQALQRRVRDEILTTRLDHLSYDRLGELPILDQLFNEVQRVHPPAGGMVRRAIKDATLGGVEIPAGAHLFLLPRLYHSDPTIWSKPQSFDPSRFADERAEHKKVPGAYIPFGGGAHKCIGMHYGILQAKIFLFQLLRRCKVVPAHDFDPGFSTFPLPRPRKGLPLLLNRLE